VELVPDGQGLQIPPDELFTQYGQLRLNQGHSDAAIQWLEKSLAARPTAAAYYYLGKARAQAGQGPAAEQAWQQSLRLDPGGVPAHEALANAALEKRDTDAALKWLSPLARIAEGRFQTAFLFQRVYQLRKDPGMAEQWRKKADELRQREQRLGMVEDLMTRTPHSFWANVARAHRFAAQGNWAQAADMLKELAVEAPQDRFVQDLANAVRQRGSLPPIERLPIKQY
jgi:tetratricopeptide (TPR) repeat protein